VPLFGHQSRSWSSPFPRADLDRSMRDVLPALIADLEDDVRNVLLTLARVWLTLETGADHEQGRGAEWAAVAARTAAKPSTGPARAISARRTTPGGRGHDRRATRRGGDARAIRPWTTGGTRRELAQRGREPIGIAGLAVLVAQEAAVTAREDDRCGAGTLGDGLAAAPRHLTFRLRAGADDDSVSRRPAAHRNRARSGCKS